MKPLDHFKNYGLTNTNTDDISVLQTNKRRLVKTPYCTSYKCCSFRTVKRVKNQRTGVYELKEVNLRKDRVQINKFADNKYACGECGEAIYWSME